MSWSWVKMRVWLLVDWTFEQQADKWVSDSIHLYQALYEFLSCEAKQPLCFALMLTIQAPKEESASKQVQVATVCEWGTNRRPICTLWLAAVHSSWSEISTTNDPSTWDQRCMQWQKGQNGLKFPIIKLLSLNPKRHNDSFSMRTWWTSQSHVDSRLALLQLTELTKGLLDCWLYAFHPNSGV